MYSRLREVSSFPRVTHLEVTEPEFRASLCHFECRTVSPGRVGAPWLSPPGSAIDYVRKRKTEPEQAWDGGARVGSTLSHFDVPCLVHHGFQDSLVSVSWMGLEDFYF